MTDIKPWWQSKTLWGALVTIASGLFGLFGLDLGETDRAALVDLLTSLGAALGGVIAIIGRIMARDRIG